MDELKLTFFQECDDLLETLQDGLADLDSGAADQETMNGIFRAAHSIKGGAGAFGMDELVSFAHTFETILDEVRSDRLEADAKVMKVFFRAADMLGNLVEAAKNGDSVDEDSVEDLIARLDSLNPSDEPEPEAFEFTPTPLAMDFGGGPSLADAFGLPDLSDLGPAEDAPWVIEFEPMAELYSRGSDCAVLVRALTELGEATVSIDQNTVPEWAELNPEVPAIKWTIELPHDVDEQDIKEIFEFVEEDCKFSINRLGEATPNPLGDAAEAAAPATDAWELPPLPAPAAPADTPPVAEETPVAEAPSPEPEVPAPEPAKAAEPEAPAKKAEPAPKAAAKAQASAVRSTIRVDLDRVDRLINLIGELVINQSTLSQGVMDAGLIMNSRLSEGLDDLRRLTQDIQDGVMAIRAQPIKPLYQRMSRIVRESSDATNKDAELITFGEHTEIDKTIIERLADPLTHMIRNAVDHGLESPEDRIAAGKEPTGKIKLSALHRSGKVIIEVADDGAGINRKRVFEKAAEKGLISPDAELSNSEIDQLLFMAGFSTAETVSNLSGRGVGMDVVKRSIQALGGRISVQSEPNEGSTFTISLPLTLAVMEGMIVDIRGQTMVLPLADIVETLSVKDGILEAIAGHGRVAKVREEFIPVVEVGHQLGLPQPEAENANQILLVAETEGGMRSALLVDGILDQRQVVIKGLDENYGQVEGIAAATILGNGDIALILDISSLLIDASRLVKAKRAA